MYKILNIQEKIKKRELNNLAKKNRFDSGN